MQKLAMGLLRPLAWGMVVLFLSLPAAAKPPIMYPDPPGTGGSGGGGAGCTNDTSAAGCSHTYAQTTQLQAWCGTSGGWVTIVSSSCFYDSTRNSACCTYQKQKCTYTDSSGVQQIVEETRTNVQTCSQ